MNRGIIAYLLQNKYIPINAEKLNKSDKDLEIAQITINTLILPGSTK